MYKVNKKAFTLVEILITLAVMSVLLIVLISNVDSATDKARKTASLTDIRSLQYAVLQVANQDKALTNDLNVLADLLNKNLDTELTVVVENNKLKTYSTDAWGNPYQLRYSRPANTNGQIQILSAGADGNFETQDDIITGIICQQLGSEINVVVKDTVNLDEVIPDNLDPSTQTGHECVFNQVVQTEKYLQTPGNCAIPAMYYYSCTCGNSGHTTFSGLKDPNVHIANPTYKYESVNNTEHVKVYTCSECQTILNTVVEEHNFKDDDCTKCNYDPHTHVYTEQIMSNEYQKSPATCTSPAVYYYICTCGAKGTQTYTHGDKLEHEYIQTISKYPSCTQKGTYLYTCNGCNNSYTEDIAMYAHSYVKENTSNEYLQTDATCKYPAKYFYSCECGDIGTNTFEYGDVNKNNHTYTTGLDYEIFDNEEHYIKTVCNGCNATLNSTKGDHVLNEQNTCKLCNSHSHVFDQQNNNHIKDNATCTTKATYFYECICGEPGTEYYEFGELNLSNHTGAIVNVGTKDVHSKYSCCKKQTDEMHSYTESITKNATCTQTGIKTMSCTCGYSYTATIEINNNNHTGTSIYGTTNDVHTQYSCCGKIISTTHNFNKSIAQDKYLKSEATCTAAAIYYKSCECGATGTSTFSSGSKGSHTLTYGGTKNVHEKCTTCKKTISSTHDYTNTVIQNATCSLNSKIQTSCNCGYSYTTTNKDRLGATDKNNDEICDDCNVPLLDNLMIFRTDGVAYLYKEDHALYSTYTGWMTQKVNLLLAPWRFDDGALEHVIIEDGVTPISTQYWFAGNNNPSRGPENLKTIVFGNGVKTIDHYTLAYCDSLESIVIKGATTIGQGAIVGNPSLTTIEFGNSLTTIDDEALQENTGLMTITLPESLTTIGDYAFEKCSNLQSIYIGKNVSNIGRCIFWYCDGLTTISINSSNKIYSSKGNCVIKTADRDIIDGCPNSIIPSDGSVDGIKDGAFTGLKNLKSITIPASVTYIGSYAFQNCGLENITILSNITWYSDPFYNCPVKTVTFGEGVTVLQSYFANKTSIETINLPRTLKTINASALKGCTGLTSITIPEKVTNIGANAFNNCTGLTEIIFNDVEGWMVDSQAIDFTNPQNNVTLLTSTYVSNTISRDEIYAEYPDALNQYSWTELQTLAKKKLTADEYKSLYDIQVGQIKDGQYILVDIDNYGGFTFMYNTGKKMVMNTTKTNDGGFAASTLAPQLETIYDSITDAALKNAIKQVTIKCNDGKNYPYTSHSYTTHLFLASAKELGFPVAGWTYGSNYNKEGNVFDYFDVADSILPEHRKNVYSSSTWWLRSARSATNYAYDAINTSGEHGQLSANSSAQVIACFVIG